MVVTGSTWRISSGSTNCPKPPVRFMLSSISKVPSEWYSCRVMVALPIRAFSPSRNAPSLATRSATRVAASIRMVLTVSSNLTCADRRALSRMPAAASGDWLRSVTAGAPTPVARTVPALQSMQPLPTRSTSRSLVAACAAMENRSRVKSPNNDRGINFAFNS